jgi:hypothetical protein
MFEAGDLLMVPFPFTDQSKAKRRPVLALTTPDAQGDFIGCPVTSRDRWPIPARCCIPIWLLAICHWQAGSAPIESSHCISAWF